MLIDGDWNAEWTQLSVTRGRRIDDPRYWDSRAPSFASRDRSPYSLTFLEYLDIREGESVFDIGCGSGTLAIPLARKGHPVCAVDFSPRMLELLREQADSEGLTNITTLCASWADDWQAMGAAPADVAIASRSLIANDLRGALAKLDAMARRRVALTVTTGDRPRFDCRAAEAIGRVNVRSHDHIYVINVLHQMGIEAELRLIGAPKLDVFANRDEARTSLCEMFGELTGEESQRLERFLDEHLVPTVDEAGRPAVKKDYWRDLRWAFITWEKAAR